MSGFASTDSFDNIIQDNEFHPQSSNVPAIFISQKNSNHAEFMMENTRIINNTIIGDSVSHYIYLLEHNAGSLAQTIIQNNQFGQDKSKVYLGER